VRTELESAAVGGVVRRLLPHGYPTLRRVAAELGLSPRTLQRRLGADGVSYRQLVLRYRFERARELLAGSNRRVFEIAHEIGYADPSSFSRFFFNFAGESPVAFRVRTLAQNG
jgi:AraC-like DNA-binding protein